ncbi:MAG: hypothetical protein LBT17_02980 [Mycoplasmataceae bacterium]|jgi:hypothetical protein|nr:hypothetical protein [Mycoplasmataceae bacterium]
MQTKKSAYKKVNRSTAIFFMYIRFAIIISNVMIFCIAISAKSAEFIIMEIINLLSGDLSDMYDIFAYVYIFLMFIFIFSTFALITIYIIMHYFSVRNKHSISLSKFEILGLIQFLVFGFIFIVLLFVGFTAWNWNSDGNELLLYIIPSLDLAIMLPTLVLNALGFIQHIWDHHNIIQHNVSHKDNKFAIQMRIIVNVITLIVLSFILNFWGLPKILIDDVGIMFKNLDDPMKIIQYINVYLVIIFIVATFFFLVIYYSLRVKKETLKKVRLMTNIETALTIFSILLITIFLLSTSVITLWASIDKESQTCLVIGLINCVLVLPTFILNITYYSFNLERVINNV